MLPTIKSAFFVPIVVQSVTHQSVALVERMIQKLYEADEVQFLTDQPNYWTKQSIVGVM